MRIETEGRIPDGTIVANGRVRVVAERAKGSAAVVYRALEIATGRELALKVLAGRYAELDDAKPRLIAEEQYARALGEHRHVVRPLFSGVLPEYGDAPFLAMEYVHGPSLSGYVRSHGVSERVRCELLRDLAGVLADVHAAGIVHRDVKPRNVLVATEDGKPVVKLTDFGIATRVVQGESGEAPEDRLTAAHERPGTKHYMAPEQYLGRDVSPAADVYALGVTAFELFTGETPMGARSELEVMRRKCDPAQPGFRLSEARPGVQRSVAALVDAALEREPERRPTAGEFRDAMVRALEEAEPGVAEAEAEATVLSPEASSATLTEAPRVRPSRRAIAWWPWAATAVIVLVAGVWLVQAQGTESVEQASATVGASFASTSEPVRTSAETSPRRVESVKAAKAAVAEHPSMHASSGGEQLEEAAPEPVVEPAPSKAPRKPEASPAVVPEVPIAKTPACEQTRAAAIAAQERGDFAGVISHAERKSCWDDKQAHRRLLLDALTNTRAWRRCVSASKGSNDPKVREFASRCEAELAAEKEVP